MSLDEYRGVTGGAPGSIFFQLESRGQHLYYAGVEHSNTPSDPALARLERFWAEYVGATRAGGRAVLIEGRLRAVAASRDDAVRAGGEGGLVTFLAQKSSDVEIASPEPEANESFERLEKQFRAEEICYAYFARAMPVWHRTEPRPRLGEFLRGLPTGRLRQCNWSVPAIASTHEHLFAEPFDPENRELYRRVSDPASSESVVNKILTADVRLRDVNVVLEILRRWRAGQSLFVVFGASHAIMQRRALEALLCPKGCRLTRDGQ